MNDHPDGTDGADERDAALSKAEYFIRRDQPQEAWEVLGGTTTPPKGWLPEQRVSWYWLAGWALTLLNKPQEALECQKLGFRLAEILRARSPREDYAHWDEMVERLRCFLGVAYCAMNNQDMAFFYHRQGLEAIIQGRIKSVELKLLIYKGLGNEYVAFARHQEAIGAYQLALQCARDSDYKRHHGYAAWALALVYQQLGDLFRAKARYREALQALTEHGNQQLLTHLRSVYALLLIKLHEYEEAEDQLYQSLIGARKLEDTLATGRALAYFATLHFERNEPELATRIAQEGLPFALESEDHRTIGHLYLVLASSYVALSDLEAAEQALKAAIKVRKASPDDDLLAQVVEQYADFLAKQKRFREAYRVLLIDSNRLDDWGNGLPNAG